MDSIGARIKARRKELGYSAEKLAEIMGISPATIYRYEKNDIANMGTDKLRPIADALSTTPDYLMGWASGGRLLDIMSYRHIDADQLAAAIDADPEDVLRMISGDLEPTHQQFQIMAKFLNVTEDCLAGKTRFAVVEPGAGELSNDTERELVSIYRDLNTIGQSVLMGTARSLSMNPDMSATDGHVFGKKV